jgi:1,2-diacylglycerol 3-alpha-glucosyltransferase
MRILMISDVYFPRVNGVSTSIQTFRRELAALGHESTLIAPAYPAAHDDDTGIVRIGSRRVPFDPEDRMMKAGEIRRLAARLDAEAYDIVHIQTPFVAHYLGVHLADRLGLPRVETYHTFFEEYLFHYIPFLPRTWLQGLARRYSRAQSRDVDALIVPSSAMRDRLGEYGVETPMHVLPTGIPLAEFSGGDGAAFRRAHRIPAGRPMLLFVGRVAFEKNIEFLIGALELALRAVPDLLLVIAGEGPASGDLKKLVARRHLQEHVLFVGYLERNRSLLDCYRAADALVLLEAMALGVPVISTAVMGTRDIVGPRRGALVPEDNEAAFAAAIVRYARDPRLRPRLSQEAIGFAREWQADAMAQRLAQIYESVARPRAALSPSVLAA